MENSEYLYHQWKNFLESAKNKTKVYRNQGKGVLIEVAAQHPLIDGKYPNTEFKERLDKGLELFNQLSESEEKVFFYIPGSLHMSNNISDDLSLSCSGKKYLISQGISADVIFGDDANLEFKGDDGVYNSTDECYVAAKLLETRGFKELYCICSPSQLMRKAFSYIRFGILPFFEVANAENLHHSYIDEYFKMIPLLISDEDALQKNSELGKKIRRYRKPDEKQ